MSDKNKPIILMRRESPRKKDFDDAMDKVLETLDGLPVTITTTCIENWRDGIHSQMNISGDLEAGKTDHNGGHFLSYRTARVIDPDGKDHAFFHVDDIQTVIVYPEEEVINQEGIQAIIYIKITQEEIQNPGHFILNDTRCIENRLTKYLN